MFKKLNLLCLLSIASLTTVCSEGPKAPQGKEYATIRRENELFILGISGQRHSSTTTFLSLEEFLNKDAFKSLKPSEIMKVTSPRSGREDTVTIFKDSEEVPPFFYTNRCRCFQFKDPKRLRIKM